jgi:hypothetical protein
MKKILIQFTFLVTVIGCSDYNSGIQKEDIVGEWKEIQVRNTKNSPIKNVVVNCEDSLSDAGICFFNPDGTYTQDDICPDKEPEQKGKWEYRDSIISLTIGKDNMKFSVSDAGKDKIKLSSLSIDIDGTVTDKSDSGFFIVLEKQ